jgi:Meiotically up-regulated gene 113
VNCRQLSYKFRENEMNNFWRIDISDETQLQSMMDDGNLTGQMELLSRLRPGHGILVANWNNARELGHVVAMGVVKSIDSATHGASVIWCNADIQLKPNPSGRQFWRNKPFFKFAKDVAIRYMLDDLFAEHFPELDLSKFKQQVRSNTYDRKERSYQQVPGYVYLMKSEYGYKIGKTVNIKSRTQLFSVKLPFPIELLHYAWFEDYSKAENDFHSQFSEKRLEGEWFALDSSDIKAIKSQGKSVVVDL